MEQANGDLIVAAGSAGDWTGCVSCSGSGYEKNRDRWVQRDGCRWIFIRDLPAVLKERFLQQVLNDERKRKTT